MKFFDALSKPFGWAGNKWSRVLDVASPAELDDRVFGGRIQERTQGVPWYKTASDPGSLMFGRADQRNSLGMERQGNKGGFFGDKAQGIDWAGSPITAGTNAQGAARLGAILYGLFAGAGALSNYAAGSGSAVVEGTGGAAEGGSVAGGSAAGGEAAGGGLNMTSTEGGGASGGASGGAGSSGWLSNLRSLPGQRQQPQQYQIQNVMYDDQPTAQMLAQLLRRY